MEYHRLRNILSSAFSIQTDLDPKSAKEAYERALQADKPLREEVKTALNDITVDWKEMLYNNRYEVYEAIDEADAFRYAKQILESELLR